MIGVGVMSPVLCHPIPFVRANEICAETQDVVDPGSFGGSSVICVVLNVQPYERLRHSKDYSSEKTTLIPTVVVEKCCGGGECVLHEEEERNVGKRTEEVTGSAEFTPSTHNLEHLGFDLPFK